MRQPRKFSCKSVAVQPSVHLPRACSVLVHFLLLISPCLLVNQTERSALASSPIVKGEFTSNLFQIGGSSSVSRLYDATDADLLGSDKLFSLTTVASKTKTRTGPSMRVTDTQALECGSFRRSVKNGEDEDAHLVDLSQPVPTTISIMRGWPAPTELRATTALRKSKQPSG